ncbi:MAG: hypothetical protein ACM3Q4_02720 [Acidobacteriota bacterium]
MKRFIAAGMIAVACTLHADSNNGKTELPRVMVVLDEKIDNLDAASRKASFRIESALLARGYRVIDAKQFDAVRQRDSAMHELNSKKALALARRFGAEVLITGGAMALDGGTREAYGFRSHVYAADASVKALATETGEVLAVFSAGSEKASQAKPSAAFKTLEAVGDSLGLAITASLEKAYEASQEHTVEIVVQGVDDVQAVKAESDLPTAAPAIKKAAIRFLEGEIATYDCTIRGGADEVRRQLTTAKNFAVTAFAGSRIDLVYRARLVKKASARVTNALEITAFSSDRIFPAQALHYVKHPIGSAVIKNTTAGEIKNITAKVTIAGYMRDASEQHIPALKPGEERSVAVFVLLDPEKLATVSQRTAAQIRMDLTYEAAGEEQTRSVVKPVSILSRHAIAWAQPQAVACYITPHDEAIEAFAHGVLADVQHDPMLLPSGSAPMMHAVKLWNALQTLAFVYTTDAWTGSGSDVLDEVRYPRETLSLRSGDCDDMTTLLASCLESVGVSTAVGVTADHVFLLFDTGVPKKNAAHVSTQERSYVVRNGTLWIPLETTLKNASFAAAWKEGTGQLHEAESAMKRFEIVETHSAWRAYPPVDLAQAEMPSASMNIPALTELVNADIRTIGQNLMNEISADVAQLKREQTEGAANRAAKLLAAASRFDEAVSLLRPYVSSVSLNNLGNVYMLQGDSLNAARSYAAAIRADRSDAGIVLNVGVLDFMTGDEEAAEVSLRRGVELLDSKERAYELLGLPQTDDVQSGTKEAEVKKKADAVQLKRLLDQALRDVQAKKEKEKEDSEKRPRRGANKFVFGGRRGIDPVSMTALKDLLYWKSM